MSENKYQGINDMPNCDKRVYNLWFQMLRRCYDESQHKRRRGRTYAKCEVCERWKVLSNFAEDIMLLEGYNDWINKAGYCLDKDIKVPGNKIYKKECCQFVTQSENIRDITKRNPNITRNANESHKTKYMLKLNGGTMIFDSEKDACNFLGVKQCTVSSCFLKGRKCKGYTIKRMDGEQNATD